MNEAITRMREHMRRFGYYPEDPDDDNTALVHGTLGFTFAYMQNGGYFEVCLYRANGKLMASYDILCGGIEVEKYGSARNLAGMATQWRKDPRREVKRLGLQQFSVKE